MAKRRRNESPERQSMREMMAGYLKENPVKNGTDINAIMCEMMSVILARQTHELIKCEHW